MAAGGMRTMSAARAEIVPARQPRVIGDRMRGPEAFIPINRSARSLAILNQAAQGMGQRVVPAGGEASSALGAMRVAPSGRSAAPALNVSALAHSIAQLASELRASSRGGVTINNEFAVPDAARTADAVSRAHRVAAALGLFGAVA